MALNIAATATLQAGQPLVVDASSPDGRYAVVFEDDGDTGVFYAVDTDAADGELVQDALQVYVAADISDAHLPSALEIGWSDDGMAALLLINDQPHAAFDFARRQGFCQSGEPQGPSRSGWSAGSRAWSDAVEALFD